MNERTDPERVSLVREIRERWRKTYHEIPPFDDYADLEIEAYWNSLLFLTSIRVKAIRKILQNQPRDSPIAQALTNHLDKLEHEHEMFALFGKVLLTPPASS